MNLERTLFVLGAFMVTTVSSAAPAYLSAERRIEAQSNDQLVAKSTNEFMPWDAFVSLGGIAATQRSTLSEGGIEFFGASSGNVFTTGASTLFARVRLNELTRLAFGGNYNRFGIIGNSEITASIIGGDYSFAFAAPQEEVPSGSFGATNVLLQPGDYDINLLSRSINFEVPALTFNLTFTTVPAPGAAGLAMAGLGAAGLRRSRRRDQRGRIAIPRCAPARVFDIGYSKPVH